MNADRELLELAAKATGIEVAWHSSNQPVRLEAGGPFGKVAAGFWNPLIDDGDALRLAVKLESEIRVFNGKAHAGRQGKFWCTESWFPDGDVYAATRRAIVRAAAELAKAMP